MKHTAQIKIFSSIISNSRGEYSFILSQQVGGQLPVVMQGPAIWFKSKEEAEEVATKVMKKSSELMKKQDLDVVAESYGNDKH